VSDTETRHDLKVGIAHYYDLRGKKRKPTECIFTTSAALYAFIEAHTYAHQVLNIAALNVAFDFAAGGLGKTLPAGGWELKKFVFTGGVVILQFRRGTRKIMVYDVLNWVRASAKQMGKLLGLPKLDVDFESVSMADLIVYCRRDVEIIAQMMLHYFDFVQSNDLGSIGPTVSSQALTAFRHRFMAHDVYIHNTQAIINLERAGYYGGRTECFRLGRVDGPIYYLDINSMYPHVMQTYEYPIKLVAQSTQGLGVKALVSQLDKYHVIASIECEITEPVIPIRLDNKTVFPVGRLKVCVANTALKYIMAHGRIRSVSCAACYKRAPIFREYVKYFHALKEKYTQEKNLVYRDISKRLMNHLYGKFGQRGYDLTELRETDDPDFKEVTYYDAETGESWVELTIFGKVYRRETSEYESFNSFPAISSAVTENARFELWDLIVKAGRKNVYYCDTDSLFTNQAGYDSLLNEINDDMLGKLKLEAVYDWVVFRGLKDYETPDYARHKGVKRNAVQISDNTFVQTHFPTFKGVLRGNMTDHIITTDVTKVLSRVYNKGVVTDGGSVAPFDLADW